MQFRWTIHERASSYPQGREVGGHCSESDLSAQSIHRFAAWSASSIPGTTRRGRCPIMGKSIFLRPPVHSFWSFQRLRGPTHPRRSRLQRERYGGYSASKWQNEPNRQNEGYSGGGFEDVRREGRGGGLLGRVLLVRRVVAEASECVSPLRLDGASRMVGRRLACRDAPRLASTSLNPRDRTLTREHVT